MKVRFRLLSVMTIFVITFTLLALMLSIFGADTTFAEAAQVSAVKVAVNEKNGIVAASKQPSGPGIYIVILQDEPLVAYKGGIQGLAATNPQARGERKLDVDSPDSVAYLNYLAQKHSEVVASISNVLGRNVTAIYQYKATLNGLAIELTPAEAQIVANLPEVKFLEREMQFELHTDAGPSWIGAPGIWDGTATGGLPGSIGEGIIVGVIDTGIDPWNPSFADLGGDSYDHTNPWGVGNYVGVCDPGDPTYDSTFPCNDKLIGAWGYATVNGGDPRDSNGHGSHTSSTAAGNFVNDTVITTTTRVFTASISGVAPHANIVMYAACCSGSALSAARDQAVMDGVDVVNYSIGATVPTLNPWTNAESQQWLNIRDAGIFVATSAGNSGPGDATVFLPGDIPWLTAVAASTHDRTFLNSLTLSDGVTGSITLNGESMTGPLITPTEVVFSSWFTAGGAIDPEDARLCADGVFSGTVDFNGAIVVCERGIYGRVAKGQTVLDAGAGGYILAQPDEFDGGPGSLASDPHVLPAVHIDYYEYQNLLNYMANASGTVNGTIAGSVIDINNAHGDILASFSSRGPNSAPLLPDILKPQVAAPGRAIWAAYGQGPGGDGDYTYNVIQGTSMASPHVAGAGALLMALHPEWTPSMIESALATTANTNVLNDDGINQATPFGIGSGRIDLSAAGQAGLVLDVTTAEFQAANPGMGGDPKELNLSSLANSNCLNTCSWTRTVSSTQSVPVTWTASVQVPAGMSLTVSPPSFVLPPFSTQIVTVTADVSALPPNQWSFAEVTLSAQQLPDAHLPIAVHPTASLAPADIIVDPATLESSQAQDVVVTLPLSIANGGGEDLNWTIFEDASARPPASGGAWSDNFDSYATGAQLHGMGGWLGWGNDPLAGAFTSDVQALSAPNSADINGSSDLIHPYTQTAGIWTYTAWQYIPSGFSGTSSFIMLNQYDHACADCNWSVQVSFDSSTGMMIDDGSGATRPFVTDEWAKIEVVIDLDTNTQTFYYNGALLYTGVWNGYISGPGTGSDAIAVVDLFADGASSIYYDDLSLTPGAPPGPCQAASDIPWLNAFPTSGTSISGTTSIVDVTFNSTGLSDGIYAGTLCVSSNDLDTPLVQVPVSMTVSGTPPEIVVNPAALAGTQAPDNVFTHTLTIENVGGTDLNWSIDEALPVLASDSYAYVVPENVDLSGLTATANPSTLPTPETSVSGGGNVLWEQLNNGGGSGIISDYSTTQGGGAYSASDFVLTGTAEITLIFADGFDNSNTLSAQPAIDWAIYPDAGGVPAGNPETNPGPAVWSYSSTPAVTGVDVTGNQITLDLVAAGESLTLPAGTYWLTVFPTYNNDVSPGGSPRWNWSNADQVGAQSHLIAPILFGGLPNWTPFSGLSLPFTDTAFRLEGNLIADDCSAPSDIPWANVSPSSGTTVSGTSSLVDVAIDSTGLATGTYTGTLCVNSNDPVTPLVEVPLTLTVAAPTHGVEIAPDAAITGTAGSTVTYTLSITNSGNTADIFDLAVSGNDWTTTLSDSSVSLGIGESATVMVTVDIPMGAATGEMDTAIVTATSQGDGSVSGSATLVTTAVSAGPSTLYLPVFIKD